MASLAPFRIHLKEQNKPCAGLNYRGLSCISENRYSVMRRVKVCIRILDMREIVPKLREEFGPVYYSGLIPKGTYPGVDYDVNTAAMAVGIFCHEK